MPLIRKRRAQAEASPTPPPTRRRRSPSASEASSIDENIDGETGPDGETQDGSSSNEQMVKKLVRLALASEYSRQPIRRADITAKIMAPNSGRQFKHVLASANHHLRTTFGMELTELPQKEKITISQKRAAQRSQSATASSNAYILTSTLPPRFRTPAILPPSRIPSSSTESAYTALYTFIIAIIALSPRGTIPEPRLERHLKRMNADNYVLGEKTEKVLKRMERENYIVRVPERDGGGEESVEFVVGPRGKAEVGERGVAGLARRVYGKKDAEAEELDRRLVRSLGEVVLEKKGRVMVGSEGEGEGEGGARRERRRSVRGGKMAREEEEEGEDEEEEGEDEEEEEDESDG